MRRRLDLGDDLLEPVLELPLDPGAGLQQAEVERAERDVAQRRRHVARPRSAGRSPSTTAVLPTPASPVRIGLFCRRRDQDVDHLADLGVAADDRVDLARAARGGQVDGELVERRGCGRLPRPPRRRLQPPAARMPHGACPTPTSSTEPRNSSWAFSRSGSRGIFPRAGTDCRITPRSASSSSRARSSEPVRTAGERSWSVVASHASRKSCRICGEKAGVRELPVSNLVEGLLHLGDQEGAVEPVLPQRPPEVGILAVGERQQLGQQVLDLDVVMGPRDAEPGRLFQRAAAERAQLVDEGLQVEAQRWGPSRRKQRTWRILTGVLGLRPLNSRSSSPKERRTF